MASERITRRGALQRGAAALAAGTLGSCALPVKPPEGGLRVLGRTGLKVSPLAFGGTLLVGYHALEGDVRAGRQRLFEEAIDHGINLFDSYNDGALGVYAALAPHRDKALVIYKAEKMSRDGIRTEIDTALRKMKRERLDLVSPHGYPWADPANPLSECTNAEKWKGVLEAMEEMARLKQSGKVGHVAYVSHFVPHFKKIILEHPGLVDAVMVRFGPFPWFDVFGEIIDLARERGLGVIAFKTLDGHVPYDRRLEAWQNDAAAWGRIKPLADRGLTPAQACIRYALSRPGVHTALVGMRTPEEIREDMAAASHLDRA